MVEMEIECFNLSPRSDRLISGLVVVCACMLILVSTGCFCICRKKQNRNLNVKFIKILQFVCILLVLAAEIHVASSG